MCSSLDLCSGKSLAHVFRVDDTRVSIHDEPSAPEETAGQAKDLVQSLDRDLVLQSRVDCRHRKSSWPKIVSINSVRSQDPRNQNWIVGHQILRKPGHVDVEVNPPNAALDFTTPVAVEVKAYSPVATGNLGLTYPRHVQRVTELGPFERNALRREAASSTAAAPVVSRVAKLANASARRHSNGWCEGQGIMSHLFRATTGRHAEEFRPLSALPGAGAWHMSHDVAVMAQAARAPTRASAALDRALVRP